MLSHLDKPTNLFSFFFSHIEYIKLSISKRSADLNRMICEVVNCKKFSINLSLVRKGNSESCVWNTKKIELSEFIAETNFYVRSNTRCKQ